MVVVMMVVMVVVVVVVARVVVVVVVVAIMVVVVVAVVSAPIWTQQRPNPARTARCTPREPALSQCTVTVCCDRAKTVCG